MNLAHRSAIERAFSSASNYDGYANVQRCVAERLADDIAALPLPTYPRVLEIGCGTGFLTEALISRGIGGQWLVTDISLRMLERCRVRVGSAATREFAVLDGEYGELAGIGQFDLICSSLALQWFDDLKIAVRRLLGCLTPGGRLMFTTLAHGTFTEWRAAHEDENLTSGTPLYPTHQMIASALQGAMVEPVQIDRYVEQHNTGFEFMRALRAIGARTAVADHQPLSPVELRRVIRNFESRGASVSYEVLTCHLMHRQRTEPLKRPTGHGRSLLEQHS